MTRIFAYRIQSKDLNSISKKTLTIQNYLKSLGYSQGLIAHLKRTPNGILKNNTWAYTRDCLQVNDILTLYLEEQITSEQILPVSMPLTITYEDEDLMIIDKPSGMPIHPSQGNYDNTLANAVAYHYKQQQKPFVYRCINRLDRDTTGLLILAKNAYSAARLSDMVGKREIHRQYLALATGKTLPSGIITAPIARADNSTIEREVNFDTGAYACTHYETLAYKNGYSLVSLQLETGRTHQIRVHMKHIGHPLPGDFLYNPDYTVIQRQALHSHKLSFQHPITKESMEFCSPLPADMYHILNFKAAITNEFL